MRKFFGCLVLIAGVASLGDFATTISAPRIQSAINADAMAVADLAVHDLQTNVSGRDLRVSGLVNDPTEFSDLRAKFEAVNGVRSVDVSGLETLPLSDPFVMTADLGPDGTATLSGVIPTETQRAIFGGLADDLPLAAGVPDRHWAAVAAQGIAALEVLKTGRMVLSGRDMRLQGLAATPSDIATLRDALRALPEGYTATFDITAEDDGTPLRLSLTLRDGGVLGGGKLPVEMTHADLTDRFDIAEPLTLTQAVVPANDPTWPDAARTGLDALARLIDGQLTFENQTLTLIGSATPDGRDEAVALLAALPTSYSVTSDIGLWDNGVPFSMTMDWDGATAMATGKFPNGFVPRGPAGVAVQSDETRSFLSDDAGGFTRNANAGVAALGLLNTGRLTVSDASILLSGTATSPQIGVVLDSVLGAVAQTADISRDITYLDDGSPAVWTVIYSAATGATVEGRLPNGLSVQDIARTLGVAATGAPSFALTDTDSGSSLSTLGFVAAYLPELETATFAREGGGSALDLVVSPGVDIDLLAVDLAERLPIDVAFSLAPLENLPPEGSVRRNAATGQDEVFSGGFWLPKLAFTADIAGCRAQANAILARTKITFVAGSARLDATSSRAIHGLAAVARTCLDAGLTLDIGGHTDATGTQIDNEVLSFERASAVLDALAQRGLSPSLMTATGFGQSQPLGDNDTDEGRAQNRRTSLTWRNAEPDQ